MTLRALPSLLALALLSPTASWAGDPRFVDGTQQGWVRALAAETKGFAPCVQMTKGICIERDRPRAAALIHFAFDSATIEPASRPLLDALGRALRDDMAAAVVRIEGHTDSTGPADYNLRLSVRRARAVRDYLTTRFAIAPRRLPTEGHGARRPLRGNATEEGRRINRRVEVVRIGTLMGP
jgi:outer membrane protein OmpA-like peptidoglycan-associated protein